MLNHKGLPNMKDSFNFLVEDICALMSFTGDTNSDVEELLSFGRFLMAFEVRPKVCQNHSPNLFCPRGLSGLAALVFFGVCVKKRCLSVSDSISKQQTRYSVSIQDISLVSPTNSVTKYNY